MPVSIPSHLPSSTFLSSYTVAFLQKLTVFQISAEKCRSTGSQSAKLRLNPHALCVLPSFLHWPSFDDPNHRQLPLSRGFVSGRTHEPWRLQSWAQNEKIVHPVISSYQFYRCRQNALGEGNVGQNCPRIHWCHVTILVDRHLLSYHHVTCFIMTHAFDKHICSENQNCRVSWIHGKNPKFLWNLGTWRIAPVLLASSNVHPCHP